MTKFQLKVYKKFNNNFKNKFFVYKIYRQIIIVLILKDFKIKFKIKLK